MPGKKHNSSTVDYFFFHLPRLVFGTVPIRHSRSCMHAVWLKLVLICPCCLQEIILRIFAGRWKNTTRLNRSSLQSLPLFKLYWFAYTTPQSPMNFPHITARTFYTGKLLVTNKYVFNTFGWRTKNFFASAYNPEKYHKCLTNFLMVYIAEQTTSILMHNTSTNRCWNYPILMGFATYL